MHDLIWLVARRQSRLEETLEHGFFLVFGLAVLWYLYRIVKHRGLRGAMFGARVAETVGELDVGKRGIVWTRVKVHRLELRDAASTAIGLEFVRITLGGFSMTPVRLTREQATALSTLLSQAAAESGTAT